MMTTSRSRICVERYALADMTRRSDDSDDEDETAALMAELAKIKQERAEEKARQVGQVLPYTTPIENARPIQVPPPRHPKTSFRHYAARRRSNESG